MKNQNKWLSAFVAIVIVGVASFSSVGCATEDEVDTEVGAGADELSMAANDNPPIGTTLFVTGDDVLLRDSASPTGKVLAVLDKGQKVVSASSASKAYWFGVSATTNANGKGVIGWMSGKYLSRKAPTSDTPTGTPGTPGSIVTVLGNCQVQEGPFAAALRCLGKKFPNARCNGPRSSWRSPAIQQELINEQGCWSESNPTGASCGVSNHTRGLAVDINLDRAEVCGLLARVPSEPWHHSLTGF